MSTTTRKRYEVWIATQTGRRWKPAARGVYFRADLALQHAKGLAESGIAACVEIFDDTRNMFLRTLKEFPA